MIKTSELIDIKNLSFRSAGELQKEHGISRGLAKVIKSQPGYQRGLEMCIKQTKEGGWRLFRRIDRVWMDASLADIQSTDSQPGTSKNIGFAN